MSETTVNNDKITDGNGNNVSHIPNVSGQDEQNKAKSEFIIRIHPNSQERYLNDLQAYTTEELLWVVAYRQRELYDKVVASKDAKSFEPTYEQVEQASIECVKECYNLGSISEGEFKDMAGNNALWFRNILAKLKESV